jgi:hypothetical protein
MGQRGGCHVVYVFAADTRDGMPQSERVMADVRLGVTVAGLYTLVGMGLINVKGRLSWRRPGCLQFHSRLA